MKKKKGLFGTIHSEYSRKGQEAVDYLLKVKEGEVPNALYHKEIGWIDLIWGYAGTGDSDGFGLAKIVKYHKNTIPNLASILKELKIVTRSKNRIKLANNKYVILVSLLWIDKSKRWLLTAYEKGTKKRNPTVR